MSEFGHIAASTDDPFELPNPPIAEPQDKPSAISDNPFDALAISGTSRIKQVWAIGGGKGGVGKSLVASSLAISLARTGSKVVAVDLDLGGANLHTALGAGLPQKTLTDFLSNRVSSLQDCVTSTGVHNLELISGAQDNVGVANLNQSDKIKILERFRELDADYLIFDLGAGTSQNTLDFFLYSDIGIVVLLPEPTSIENAYRFIKSVYYRRLLLAPKLESVRPLIRMSMDLKNNLEIKTPSDLYQEIRKSSSDAAQAFRDEIQKMGLKLIINQTRTQTDVDIGFSVKSVCKKYFGIDMDYIGYLDYDSAVWQAVRRKRPLLLEFPNSQLVSSFDRIVNYLIKRYGHQRNSLI